MKRLLFLLLLASAGPAFSQHPVFAYYDDEKARTGYWQVATDYVTRSTTIRFFGADSLQIYQETLPNQMVKLTRKNIRKLDETLARLTAKKLISSSVHPSELPSENELKALVARRKKKVAGPPEKSTTASKGLQIGAYPTADGMKMNLVVSNPEQELLTVQLFHEGSKKMFETHMNYELHRYKFDMNDMPLGKYQMIVISRSRRLVQNMELKYPATTPRLKLEYVSPVASSQY